MVVPAQPKIYHIVDINRLSSIIHDNYLWCDSKIRTGSYLGSTIGMDKIKQRRLHLKLACYPDLHVGDCVPFYFCPRSVMLYLISQKNHPDLQYREGAESIIHLEADLHRAVDWAEKNDCRWAFTLSNAGSNYFEDRRDLKQLDDLNWDAIHADRWGGAGIDPEFKEGKQAEFLMEHKFPWDLFEMIGVPSQRIYRQVLNVLPLEGHRPEVRVRQDWYY